MTRSMPTSREILEHLLSLPIEERVWLADSLLTSLNPPDDGTEREWVDVAKRRLEEIRSGGARLVPGDEVMRKVLERFAR